MDYKTLEEVVRSHIQLSRRNSNGWEGCVHLQCDHGKKGDRAAFLFADGSTAFNCFNCGISTVYDPSKHRSIPNKLADVLQDFNIPETEWQGAMMLSMVARDTDGTIQTAAKTQESIEPKEIILPEEFYYLKDGLSHDDQWSEIAAHYLKQERGIDPLSHPFMLCKTTNNPHMRKWRGRVIFPIYKTGKLIYYQGRDLTNKLKKKYESPSEPKDKVMYGFEKLFERTDIPLYVVEGFMDAHVIDGIAILGNRITDAQAAWLNKSSRKKVYIPDRFGDGKRVAEQCLKLGWCVSTPEVGSCKDMNAAVSKYGRIYVMKQIAENTAIGFEAKTKLGLYCK